MTSYANERSRDLDATKSDGTTVSFVQTDGGCTLGVATYYFVIGGSTAPLPSETALVSAHLKWAAAVAATITVETCNFPTHVGGGKTGAVDVSGYDSAAGNWIQENPSTAIVAVTGTGNSATALTVTAGGTNAGGCMIHLGNLGSRRVRVKVVTTVGGIVRCSCNGKSGA